MIGPIAPRIFWTVFCKRVCCKQPWTEYIASRGSQKTRATQATPCSVTWHLKCHRCQTSTHLNLLMCSCFGGKFRCLERLDTMAWKTQRHCCRERKNAHYLQRLVGAIWWLLEISSNFKGKTPFFVWFNLYDRVLSCRSIGWCLFIDMP